tara:strand:+ start:2971 stop:3705 length:735 start_codon:yes stop_codon:yes gene_type:complete
MSFFLVVIIWLFSFDPIMHYLLNTEEAYMEDVIGMYESDAIDTLRAKGFNVDVSYLDYQEKFTPYTVFDMFPKPFTKIKKNRIVELSVFKDKSTISVPNYIGLDLREVQRRVKKDKLKIGPKNIIPGFNSDFAEGEVYHQSPNVGENVLEGDSLTISVSTGSTKGLFVVPDEIIGFSVDHAILELRLKNFPIGKIDTVFNEKYLEDTVWEIYYNAEDDQKVEIYEGDIFTVPLRVNLVINKDEE